MQRCTAHSTLTQAKAHHYMAFFPVPPPLLITRHAVCYAGPHVSTIRVAEPRPFHAQIARPEATVEPGTFVSTARVSSRGGTRDKMRRDDRGGMLAFRKGHGNLDGPASTAKSQATQPHRQKAWANTVSRCEEPSQPRERCSFHTYST